MSSESFQHLYAKQLLAKFLIKSNECIPLSINGIVSNFTWRSNRPSPFGVWLEYPWTADQTDVWDEAWEGRDRANPIPTLQEYLDMNDGCYPDCIWDIAIQHKGRIMAAFEVVHTHDMTEDKIAHIHNSDMIVFVVSAQWIMSQESGQSPSCIKIERHYGNWIPVRSDNKQRLIIRR